MFTVFLGASLSVLYHLNPDLLWLMLLDHLVAVLWFLTDLVFASDNKDVFIRVFFLNIFVFGAWLVFPADMHSSWHIISAIKCYCVATLMSDLYKNRSIS
jgi:hypothetical protein